MLFCAVAGVSSAESNRTVITVQVKDQRDKPVDRAIVILDFLAGRKVTKLMRREGKHWEIRTNQQGTARFPSISQGTVRVQVIASNFQTFGDKFDINQEEKTIDVKLNPPQKQYSAHEPENPEQKK